MPIHRPNPDTDPFRPPAIPTEVVCIHCQQEYESYLIQWQERTADNGRREGCWACPTPGCSGKGFGFDIFPIDPEYRDEQGQPMSGPFADEEDDGVLGEIGNGWFADEDSDLPAWSGEPIDADALLNEDNIASHGGPASDADDLDDDEHDDEDNDDPPSSHRRDHNDGFSW
ncbi:hypothetical protein ACERK3_16660 [Phycisphaerales bacterium AB-hyl4]|uniref:Uncharacterized protein n=1 Tax=Natronomicrosphaera hydrolytica TaxID=3242702 RepID=A0ABV4U9F4_9BACT